MIVKKLRALEFLICGILILFLLVGCAKQKADPTGIYLAIGGQAYVEIGMDDSGNLVVKETSLFSGLPEDPDYESKWHVSFKRQKLILVFGHKRPAAAFESSEGVAVNSLVSRIYYEFLPSSTTPGDWDLVGQYDWSGLVKDMPPIEEMPKREERIPSYLHRVDDRRVVEYFNLVGDYVEVVGPGPALGPEPDVDRLFELASGLLESHPGDLYVCTLYLDVLVRKGDHETLDLRLTSWREAYETTDDRILSKVFRGAENNLKAMQLSAAGRNANDFVEKVLGPEIDLATRLELFPNIIEYKEYLHPRESLILPKGHYLYYQIAVKIFLVEAEFLMLEGKPEKREEALKILAGIYHFGCLLNQSDTIIDRLIGMAIRRIACEGLRLYILNCCKTRDEFLQFWEMLGEIGSKAEEKELGESLPISVNKKEFETRQGCADAHFQLVRMATAAKYRFVTQKEFPRSADEFAPFLPEGPPEDPFGLESLKFISDPESFTCYSIGPDEHDDRAIVSYDPTNGTVSPGDLFIAIPR